MTSHQNNQPRPVGTDEGATSPHFHRPKDLARVPSLDDVKSAEVGLLGVFFEVGQWCRPGVRFGPAAIDPTQRGFGPIIPIRPSAHGSVGRYWMRVTSALSARYSQAVARSNTQRELFSIGPIGRSGRPNSDTAKRTR
jgi:hypothetical protein